MEHLVLSSRKQGLLFLFIASFFLVDSAAAEVRRVCPRLEGIEFAQCQGGAVHVATPDVPIVEPPIVVPPKCTGKCYRVTGSGYQYYTMVAGTPANPGQTHQVCAGGITPGVACEAIVGPEGQYTGRCREGTGTGDTCAGGWTTEIIPGTATPAGPPVCAVQYASCADTVVESDNTPAMFGMCTCGPTGTKPEDKPNPPACERRPSTCTPP